MEYREFVNEIRKKVEELLGESYQVTVQTVLKDNNQKKEALCITRREKSVVVTPVLYLEDYYVSCCKGEGIEDCARRIQSDFHTRRILQKEMDVWEQKIMDWEMVRENIYPILLSQEKNRELLQTVVSRNMLDLAVCYIIREKHDAWEYGRVKVSKQMAQMWDVTEDIIYLQAMENLRNDGYQIRGLNEIAQTVMEELGGSCEEEFEMLEEPETMYVLTNKEKIYGVMGLLLGKGYFQKAFGRQSLYIIPSSVHELILMPYDKVWTVKQLNSMVQEVNREQLEPEEILADHVYLYNGRSGVIRGLQNSCRKSE